MSDFGFVGPSYEAASIYQEAQECINFYPEIDPLKPPGSRGVVALYPTPGLTSILQLNNAPVRAMRTLSGGQYLIAIVGNIVYSITKTYSYTQVGTLTTSTGQVSITDNILQNTITTECNFVGSISGTTLLVTTINSGALAIGQELQVITGSGIVSGTKIISGSGSTWTVSISQTVPSSTILSNGYSNFIGLTAYIVDGQNRYFYNVYSNTFVQLPSSDGPWQGANVCDVVDNYIIYNQPGTQNWAATDLNSCYSTNAYYGAKDGSPDPLVSLIVDHRQVFLLGEFTAEMWTDVGNVIPGIISFPFQRVTGTSVQHGIAAPFSVARFGEQFAFVSQDYRGQNIIGVMQGYSFKRISTHAVEQTLMNQYIADAIAYTYQLDGHEFYVVTFPTINITWVFDLASEMWHKWLSWDGTQFNRHRSNCGAIFNNVYLVGDYANGQIYQLDNAVYTEAGNTIRRLRRCPHLVTDLQRQYFAELQIQFQPGVGLENGQGQNPQAMLRWSNDGGSTYSNEHWCTIGAVGKYRNRAIWRRLGTARDRIYEVSISDPVKTVIVSANLKAEIGEN